MQKKLTISIEEQVYNNLHSVIGKRKISKFIENIVKPYVNQEKLFMEYKNMSSDIEREKEANEWTEGLLKDDFS